MTRLPKPCLGARLPDGSWEACGVLGPTSRCARHRAMAEARRGTPTARGYDARHRRDARSVVFDSTGSRRRCALRLPGCTTWAETADHVVARVDGERVPEEDGGRLLVPACRRCNSSRGARDVVAVEAEEVGLAEDPWTPDP